MTAVSIVSAVAARIEKQINESSKHEQSSNDDAKDPLSNLKELCKSLKEAAQKIKDADKNSIEREKEIVQLSYEIDDAIVSMELAIPSKHKGATPWRTVIDKLKELINNDVPRRETGLKERSTPSDQTVTQPATTKRTLPFFKRKNISSRQTISHLNQGSLKATATSKGENDQPQMGQDHLLNNKVPVEGHQADTTTSPNAAADSTGEDLPQLENKVKESLFDKKRPVVCIRGESGMGKTTLVKKVFHDPDVRKHFKHFAWVPINQDSQTKSVLQNVLLQLLPDTKADIRGGMDEIKLTQQIFTVQEKDRCLVVLEGIEAAEDWQSIRVAFPINCNYGTTIVITTTSENVGELLGSGDRIIYEMPPLTQAHCNKILMEEAKFDDADLHNLGEIIFGLSQGSRLFAEILVKSLKDDPKREQLLPELVKYKNQTYEGDVLGLCYDRLPHELKPCLLYMGQFPEGQDIEVDKLQLFFAAENIIPPDADGKARSVRDMLQDLRRRKLVEIQENNKYCQLHNQVRKFCISKGLDEEFFQIVDFANEKPSSAISADRVAMYLSKYKDKNSITFSGRMKIRSLLIYDKSDWLGKSTRPSEINDLGEFSSLKVLDFDGVDLRPQKFPRGIDKIELLRYLSFRGCWLEILPSSLCNLVYLETLDLRVVHGDDDCKMKIPNIFSDMRRLRHLYLPMLYEKDGKSKLKFQGLERLVTLVNFDTEECEIDDLSKLNNVEIIAVISEGKREQLEPFIRFLEKNQAKLRQSSLVIRDFDCYMKDRATMLKNLLECSILQSLHIEGEIGQLPKDVKISNNFVEMVFDGSEFEDDGLINVLGKIENLERLVLSNDAFVGDKMVFSAASDQFAKLTSLKLQNLWYTKEVEFEKGSMTKLLALVIDKCDYLEKVLIPKELHEDLQNAQKSKGDDVYLVQPSPTITD